MIIEKSELASKLSKIRSAIPSRTAIPALQGVLLKNSQVTAYNLDVGITARLSVQSDEQMIIPTRAVDMIEALPEGMVEIAADTDNNLLISARSIRNRFSTYAVADYPDIPEITGGNSLSIESSELTKAITSVLYAVTNINTRPILTGVYFEAGEGTLNIVGCDGYRLAWYQLPTDNTFRIVVPKDSVQKMLSLKTDGSMQITYDTKRVVFKSEEYAVFSRLLDGEYLKFKQTVPRHTNTARIDCRTLSECVRRALLCIDVRAKSPIKLDFHESRLNLSINSPLSDYFETISLETPVESAVKIGFNAQYLYDALRSFDSDIVEVQLGTESTPIVLKDGPLTAMVAATRLSKAQSGTMY